MGQFYGIDGAYNVNADGVTVVSSGTSQFVTIPNTADGNRARIVRLQVTGNLYVKFGKSSSVTATTNSMLLSPSFDVPVNCKQFDTVAYLQEVAGAKLNITPLEA